MLSTRGRRDVKDNAGDAWYNSERAAEWTQVRTVWPARWQAILALRRLRGELQQESSEGNVLVGETHSLLW